jgi:tetratricopeptide (TPR) repeat protein
MADDSWFRNESWDEAIALAFDQKLKRARQKSQYLRIQACALARTHPRVALELLDRYFALGDDFDQAQAHVDRATAYLALGDIDSAIQSYEAALERERAFPNLRTGAYLDLPYLIAINGLTDRFDQAMTMLSGSEKRLMFPVDRFKHHAARAVILAKSDLSAARLEAKAALEEAALDHSGFSYHPTVGLVSERHAQALSKVRRLCDAEQFIQAEAASRLGLIQALGPNGHIHERPKARGRHGS